MAEINFPSIVSTFAMPSLLYRPVDGSRFQIDLLLTGEIDIDGCAAYLLNWLQSDWHIELTCILYISASQHPDLTLGFNRSLILHGLGLKMMVVAPMIKENQQLVTDELVEI